MAIALVPLAASPHIPFNALYTTLMVLAVAVSVLVFALLATSLLRSRGQDRQNVPPDFGNRRLEITWTVIPVLVVIFLFTYMFIAMRRGPTPGTGDTGGVQPDVQVVGHRWWWEFRYLKQGGAATANELHLPVGSRALLLVSAADVQHDFWVPQLGQKMDAYPNKTNYVWLDTTKPGTYLGVCAEYCGTQHAWMRIRVIVQPQAEFDAWVAQLRAAPAPSGDLATRGGQIFAQNTCGSCHAIAGTSQQGQAAPALTNFGSRETISAGVLPNTPENLARYLRDPGAVKPGVLMPNFRLSDDDIAALVAYLEGLK